jgi:hypothetical protein
MRLHEIARRLLQEENTITTVANWRSYITTVKTSTGDEIEYRTYNSHGTSPNGTIYTVAPDSTIIGREEANNLTVTKIVQIADKLVKAKHPECTVKTDYNRLATLPQKQL